MTFEQWWKDFVKNNLTCINHKKDFKKCWDACIESRREQDELNALHGAN